ncbi:GNAT family N-acetyltransferase [Shewanella intestini]|uniref:GNAT family N-acetyltransferase n=1 Tax=Shewanella intestini TaxID=2017544 RepID=A0ABS5I5V7_9GAMM|nr:MULTISPECIES: GNAT family N-acetyltransferase [Shewanella]MBR9729402.1 GNAT family N-acetyltransferase [Shewanella intestini]MRG37482.1 GNAT family N-acetyltransferase [Shewanella sp. XMDDZSB0408]
MSVLYRVANFDDAAHIALLEQRHCHDELNQDSGMMAAQSLSVSDMATLISQHWVVIAEQNSVIVGYVIAAKWAYYGNQGLYSTMQRHLAQTSVGMSKLTSKNTCQYGPVWVHSSLRGQGIFEGLMVFLVKEVKPHVPFMVAIIAEGNERSFAAHTQKGQMQVIDYLTFEQRDYYLLARAC